MGRLRNEHISLMTSDRHRQYVIRALREGETGLLKDFLHEAIFIPEGIEAPPRDIVEKPELRVYTDDFGNRKGDNCLVADFGGKVVGAVWTRIMDDYGHVDDETPSFAISLYKESGTGHRLTAHGEDARTSEMAGLQEGVTGDAEGELCREDVQECRVQDGR